MEHRPALQGALSLSRIGLGTMTFGAEADEATSHALLDTYLDAGGTLIDTADVYSDGVSEQIIGRWLAADPGRRDRVLLATKGRMPMPDQPGASLSKDYLHTALRASLARLGVDHVDLYQSHGPDLHTPMTELAEFFAEAHDAGLIRAAGVSNLPGWQIATLATLADQGRGPRLATHQPQYNLLSREVEWEVLPAARAWGVPALVWGPLAAGWLTGKYRRDQPPPKDSRLGDDPDRGLEAWTRRATKRTWAIIEKLVAVAEGRGVTPAQAALAWVADRPGVGSALIGARRVEQLHESLAAADLHLDRAAAEQLDAVSAPPTPDYPYGLLADLAAS